MRELQPAIERLREHFETVSVHPPANSTNIQLLRSRVPNVPEALVSLFGYCDGISVKIQGVDEGQIFSIRELLRSLVAFHDASLFRLLPLRGDGCGNYDCMVAGAGVCEEVVVFWDHEVYERPDHLLAGSLVSYLDMWSDYLVHGWLRDGQRNPRYFQWPEIGAPDIQHPWPYDEAWMRRRDPDAERLLSDLRVRAWLVHQDGLEES